MSAIADVEEAFAIYHENVLLQLRWRSLPPLPNREPVIRICCIDESTVLVLTADFNLYMGYHDRPNKVLQLQLVRNKVRDIDYCPQLKQFFAVLTSGAVFTREQCTADAIAFAEDWHLLSFDPLELSEDGVLIERVCCSSEGVLFATCSGELYALGSCGSVFSAETQPKHVRLFDESKALLDIAAGKEYFVIMLETVYNEKANTINLIPGKGILPSTSSPHGHGHRFHSNQLNAVELEFSVMQDKNELNSTSSLRSFSSKSSHSNHEYDSETIVQRMLLKGYALIHTQVHTFGANNRGLLGTGDHVKRSNLNNLQRLDSIGVCGIAAGEEHTIARTLDGRIYHWGLNNRQQLNNKLDLVDLSAPTELKVDYMEWDEQQRSIVGACCGQYNTILVNAREEVVDIKQRQQFDRDVLSLHIKDARQRHSPLLLASNMFTVHNMRRFQRDYHNSLQNMRRHLQLLLKYRHAIQMLQIYEQKTKALSLQQIKRVSDNYQRILCLSAALLNSLEAFYRGDSANPSDVLFIKYYRECIQLYENYTKSYCDIFSINGYAEASRTIAQMSGVPPMPDQQADNIDLARIFHHPFAAYTCYLYFIEQLLKSRHEYTEHLLAWQASASQNRIDLELAENTLEFWKRNDRNLKIRHFRRLHRRVILTSTTTPLKLSGSISISSPIFILFSDCFLQLGSNGGQLQTYPLTVMWLKIESDTGLQITTPERTFTVNARSHFDKMLWHDQLESAICLAMRRNANEITKVPNERTATYVFSRNHSKYAGVHAFGHWRHGKLHGSCYLEYPDGKCYFGQMRNGEIEGYGKMLIPTTGMYEGNFRSGKFHGHGTYEMKDNTIYEGNFRDGLFHGHGTMRCNNYTYVGEYQVNVRCGYGVLDDINTGNKYMGMFADNKQAGTGICITMNGDYFEAFFANDELSGTGIAVFESGYYYEGELSMLGPNGKGKYYMPNSIATSQEDSGIHDMEEELGNRYFVGNILSGQLTGHWMDVRVTSGNIAIDRHFSKYPQTIGDLIAENDRKWRSLFDNFEEDLYGTLGNVGSIIASRKTNKSTSAYTTKDLWNRIAVYMANQRDRARVQEQDSGYPQNTHNYFAKNISLEFGATSLDKISMKSSSSLLNTSIFGKSNSFEINESRHSQSQETLCDGDIFDNDLGNSYSLDFGQNQRRNTEGSNSFQTLFTMPVASYSATTMATSSLHSSIDSALNLSDSFNNSLCSHSEPDFMPSFGINSLNEHDITAIKEYLSQAFKDHCHPLALLNQRIADCFYTSYGCWKVKPTPILAKQAMREWESITRRVYLFIRKLFPALPEDYCELELSSGTREVISHITLLYPIVLSEGIYSTLFVLYANKYSGKDEIYRQNVIHAKKLNDAQLVHLLGLESSLLSVVCNECFVEAVQTLKQLQEKYSPKAMLNVIETCMQQITDAHKSGKNEPAIIIGADSMMPLTLFLVLRADVAHLGAELALLGDLTGDAHFQCEMNGMAGYCYTTLKAAYQHITAKPFHKQ